MVRRAHTWAFAVFLSVTAGGATAASADWAPNRPVRFILPYPAGGTSDMLGRAIAQRLGDPLGQQVAVDNRPGADGIIAYSLAANSRSDGHTLLLMATSFTVNPSLHRSLPYDPIKSFSPIGIAAVVTNVIAVHPSVPGKSLGDLVTLARANPGKLNYAGSGMGTASVLGVALLSELTNTKMTLIPYKGTPLLVNDLIAGQVDLTLNSLPGLLPYMRSGRIRPIVVAGAMRSPVLPDVPTISESGYPGFEANTWYGILAPAGTPVDAVRMYNAEINTILKSPDVAKYLLNGGFEVTTGTSQSFGTLIQREIAKWGEVVQKAGIMKK